MARNTGKISEEQRDEHFKGWKKASRLITGLSAIARNEIEQAAISTVLSMGDEIITAHTKNLKDAADDALITHESAKRIAKEKSEAHKALVTKKADKKKVDAAHAELKAAEKAVEVTGAAHDEAVEAHDEVAHG